MPRLRRVAVVRHVLDALGRPGAVMSPRWSLAAILAGTLAAIAFVLGPAATLTPDIHPPGPSGPTRTPQPVRTAHSGAPGTPPVAKTDQIIEQNLMCWLAIPGATCDPNRRTYL